MTYTIEPLAPGSYDVLLDGTVIAGLLRGTSRDGPGETWSVELLDERPAAERPAPFTDPCHIFPSRSAALAWLGITRDDRDLGRPA